MVPMGCAAQIHKKQVIGELEVSTQLTDGTYRHLHTTIGSLRYGVNTQEQSEFLTLCFLKHKHLTNPTVSPEDALLQAAKEFTAALKVCMPEAL